VTGTVTLLPSCPQVIVVMSCCASTILGLVAIVLQHLQRRRDSRGIEIVARLELACDQVHQPVDRFQ